MTVKLGILGQANQFPFMLSQNGAFRFFSSCDLKDFFHILTAHPSGSTVCSGIADGKSPFVLSLARILAGKSDIENKTRHSGYRDTHSFQTVQRKSKPEANERIDIRTLDLHPTGHTARRHPVLVVTKQLPDKSTYIKKCDQPQYGSNHDTDFSGFIIHSKALLSAPIFLWISFMSIMRISAMLPKYWVRK